MDYRSAKLIRDRWAFDAERASANLQRYPKLANGLVPDEVRTSSAYRMHKHLFDTAFQNLRHWNTYINKHHAAAAKADRKLRKSA